ncbi:hypothetical protein LA6_002374 [Marinibacterium anthonyi]|nr:hypothetical protein LA6_002374 [Marinibacterium anthonyi]
MIGLAVIPASAAAIGLALMDGRLRAALWLTLRVGLGVALWAVLWRAAAAWLGVSGRLEDLVATPLHVLAVNAGLALATALIPALILRLSARRAKLGALHGLAWFAGLILPQLGQGGAWPPASLALAVIGAAIAMTLGLMAAAGRR